MKKRLIIFFTVIAVIIFTILIIYYGQDKTYVAGYIEDLGYKFDNSGIYYKKIASNNTLDDFYTDVDRGLSSEYLEYYFSTDTYSFIELYMVYKDSIMETFNINTDLSNNKTTYTYELTKDRSDIILEGEYDDASESYTCNVTSLKLMDDTYVADYCSFATEYGNRFLEEEKLLLSNKKFQEILKK